MTTYQPGDVVRANVEAQGMKKGETFIVKAAHAGAFGTVTYEIENAVCALTISNGHLLLTRLHHIDDPKAK